MKSLFKVLLVAVALVAAPAYAAEGAIVIFGGNANALSGGGSQTATDGNSGAALFGIAGTTSQSTAINTGAANGTVAPSGATASHVNASGNQGSSGSAAFGLAGAGSDYTGNAAGLSGATASQGSVGLGFFTIP